MQPIIAGNWKMNKTAVEAVETIKQLKGLVKDIDDRIIIVCPTFTSLIAAKTELHDSNIKLGAQNLYFEEKGAFTGEISPEMVEEFCDYVIIGHSERRQYFNETDEIVNKKIKAALKIGLMPIVCIGETEEERNKNKTVSVIKKQIKDSLKDIDLSKIIIAYEPIWAIGTGNTATPQQAEEVHALIRSLTAKDVPILYGGSVKSSNIKELMEQKDIDGALVGGASLDAEEFSKIIKF